MGMGIQRARQVVKAIASGDLPPDAAVSFVANDFAAVRWYGTASRQHRAKCTTSAHKRLDQAWRYVRAYLISQNTCDAS